VGRRLTGREARATELLGVDRREREVRREEKRPPAREENTVARLQQERFGEALDRQPALAGGHRVALDAVVRVEPNGEVGLERKAARGVAA
jgi:hypothetical protein